MFVNGVALASSDKKQFIIDTQGNAVIAPDIQGFTGILNMFKELSNRFPYEFSDLFDRDTDMRVIRNLRKSSASSLFSVLRAGYVPVYEVRSTYSGDRYYRGVLNTSGNWIMPLNDTCGTQEEIQTFVKSRELQMFEGKIDFGVWEGWIALDPAIQKIISVTPSDGWVQPLEDWQFYNNPRSKEAFYMMADGSVALRLQELYPTVRRGRDFLGDYAVLLFYSGTEYFAGVIDKTGALLFEPIALGPKSYRFSGNYGMLNDHMFYASKMPQNITDVYGLDGKLPYSLEGEVKISPFSDGIALVEGGPAYYINEAGEPVIGKP